MFAVRGYFGFITINHTNLYKTVFKYIYYLYKLCKHHDSQVHIHNFN